MNNKLILLIGLLTVLLTACGGYQGPATATPTEVLPPTSTRIPFPTATVIMGPTIEPTIVVIPTAIPVATKIPTVVPEVLPTVTIEPTKVPSPTVEPTPTIEPTSTVELTSTVHPGLLPTQVPIIVTVIVTATSTPIPTPTPTITPTPTSTPVPTVTPTPIPTVRPPDIQTRIGNGPVFIGGINFRAETLLEIRFDTIQPGDVTVQFLGVNGGLVTVFEGTAPFDETFIYRVGGGGRLGRATDFIIPADGARWYITTGSVINRAIDVARFQWHLNLTQGIHYGRDTDGNYIMEGTGQDFSRDIILKGNGQLAFQHLGASYFIVELLSAFNTVPDQILYSDNTRQGPVFGSISINPDLGEYILRVRTDATNQWSVELR
jgi:hypothetical protein